MEGWLPGNKLMPAMTSDLVVSSDNSFIVISNFLQGDVQLFALQKDSSSFPICKDTLNLGGRGRQGRSNDGEESDDPTPMVNGKRVLGGPARLHLSKDGRRLYVTNSYCNLWDHEFYPNSYEKESQVLLVHIDIGAKPGRILRLDKDFLIDFNGYQCGEEFIARCVKTLI
jgi:selenium-binding protein 1